MKMIMAFNVVGIHVGTYFDLNYSSNVNFVLDMAVPFFFICSGFFIQNKVSKSNDLFCVLKRSFVRYLKLYLLWHIIYFPVALRFLLVNSHDFKENLIYCVHNFLFVGEIVLSWPLWYLHGLIVSIILVYFLYKIKLSLIQIWIVSIMLMLLGYFIGIASVSDEYSSIKAISQSIVGLLGSAERNGPFRGFALVTTGMVIQKYLKIGRYNYVLGVSCIAISYYLYYNSLPLYLILCGGGLFVAILSIRISDHPLYVSLSFYSTMVYFIHMFFIIIAHMLLKNNVNNATHIYLIWFIVFIVAWIVAIIMHDLKKHHFFKWINYLV